MTKENTKKILNTLDKEYGTVKEGFVHTADWQLLTAIMLSAQSTDKQVDEALPGLWAGFPDISAIVGAPLEDLEEAIKSIGLYKVKARNIKKCCEMLCEEYNGKVPKTIEELVEDGIRSKLYQIGEESQVKLQDTMQKIVNDSNGGLVCIII